MNLFNLNVIRALCKYAYILRIIYFTPIVRLFFVVLKLTVEEQKNVRFVELPRSRDTTTV